MSSTCTFCRTFSTIRRITAPIIYHIIHIIDRSSTFCIHIIMIKPWITTIMVCQQIMMEGSIGAAPYTAITMVSLHMHRTTQRFCNKAILQCEIRITIATHTLIRTPGERTVVHHYIFLIINRECIPLYFILIPHTETQETHNHITCFHDHWVSRDTYTISWGCLSCDGYITALYLQLSL